MWRKGWIDDDGVEVDLCNACGARRARDETRFGRRFGRRWTRSEGRRRS